MRIEVISLDAGLSREVWVFTLLVDSSAPHIYFDYYTFQTKESHRHRNWHAQSFWRRGDARMSNIERPNIPTEIVEIVHSRIQQEIAKTPIEE